MRRKVTVLANMWTAQGTGDGCVDGARTASAYVQQIVGVHRQF
jgi:hypothetical protein